MSKLNPTTEIAWHSGMVIVSDIIDGYLITRQYMGYTKQEAIQAFIDEQTKGKTEQ